MDITYHEKTRMFHLYNESISYIMMVLDNGQIGQLYYGQRVPDKSDYSYLIETAHRPMTSYLFEGNLKYSLEHLKQEYPSYGTTDFRLPAFEIKQENGSTITNLEYQSHSIYLGKRKLKGLPALYCESEHEATSLDIVLIDSLTQLKVILTYTIAKNFPVISRSVQFINEGNEELQLTKAMSLSLDLPDDHYEMIQLTGAWSRERYIKTRKLEKGIQSIGSLRGHSSHTHNPFIALKRKSTNETSGEVIAASLIYSGNFLAQVEVDAYDVSRLTMGIHPHNFEWCLKPDCSFQTPEAVLVYTNEGLNGMSHVFHTIYRKRLARGYWRDKDRPILINNWEATYFDFNEDKLVDIAKTAHEVGIELFVLDDGWFGKRENDLHGLGDWHANLEKLPSGISGLSKRIEDECEMKFGLWFEPEMINKRSELFKAHPEYLLSTPNRNESHGRNQFVLNFSYDQVVENIFEQMYQILSTSKVSYVKWDMNRSLTEVYSQYLLPKQQGEVFHRYILGVYKLYEKLIEAFPNILFESCSSGGGRFDPGMLYYAPQTWTSDNSDAIERLKIQYGTSLVYPLSSMGAHVSMTPNHQMFRNTPIETRGNVAYFGTFGYELNLNDLSHHDLEIVKQQVAFVKKHRSLVHHGDFYRLLSPFEGNKVAWVVVSKDRKEALFGYYKILNDVLAPYCRIKMEGLLSHKEYYVEGIENSFSGDELMNIGLVIPDPSCGQVLDGGEVCGDYYSKVYYLHVIE